MSDKLEIPQIMENATNDIFGMWIRLNGLIQMMRRSPVLRKSWQMI